MESGTEVAGVTGVSDASETSFGGPVGTWDCPTETGTTG